MVGPPRVFELNFELRLVKAWILHFYRDRLPHREGQFQDVADDCQFDVFAELVAECDQELARIGGAQPEWLLERSSGLNGPSLFVAVGDLACRLDGLVDRDPTITVLGFDEYSLAWGTFTDRKRGPIFGGRFRGSLSPRLHTNWHTILRQT